MKEIFPLIFGRTGGHPIEALSLLRSNMSEAYVNRFLDLSSEVEAQRSTVVEKLYTEINNEQDERKRKCILNFKRDLFNNRPRAATGFKALAFRKEIESEVKRFFQKKDECENLVKEFNTIFCSEELNNVEKLNSLTSPFFFRNGLIFSSQVLFQELKKRSLAKTDGAIVTSLLKYLTRSVTKTTPFSSFNSIFFLQKKAGEFSQDGITQDSTIQVSNLFYHYLKIYLLNIPSFRDTLLVKSNSTIWLKNDGVSTLHFFQNEGNNESFKNLRSSSSLVTIKNLVSNIDITYGEFVLKLQQLSADPNSSVEEFVTILVKEGFLKIVFPVSWTDKNWISELIDFLHKNQLNRELEGLTELLKVIDKTIVSLENCFDVDTRYEMVLHCFNAVSDFFKSNDPSNEFLEKVSAQDLFYEDHFVNSQESVAETTVTELLSEVKEAFLSFNNIPVKLLKRVNMARLLEVEGKRKLPILSFYEKFYLPNRTDYDFLKDEVKKADKTVSEIIRRIEEAPERQSVDISDLAEQKRNELDSPFGVYIQTEDGGFENTVVNSFCSGYGMNISRFLNSLPEKYAKELMTYNEDLLPGKIVVEIKDASIHNVGTFPQVTEALVDLCENRNLNRSHRVISLADIFVTVNEAKDLIFVDSNNRELKILNFSLEDLNRRSAFYKFIDTFNDTDLFGLNYLLGGIAQFFESKVLQAKIVSIPRIKFRERLTIQRRRWLILKTTLLNSVSKTKEKGENFLNLNAFMIKNAIPEEVFIKFAKRNLKNLQDDKHKPQYFNFRFPVFTALFIDQLNKAGDVIEISEMFPSSDGVMKTGGKVKEYIFNCN
jgi:lantibiotic biosynthesis protein